jgi:hypothetical protein
VSSSFGDETREPEKDATSKFMNSLCANNVQNFMGSLGFELGSVSLEASACLAAGCDCYYGLYEFK